MKSWFLAARPKTLPAGIVPVWVGSMPLLVDGDPTTGSWMLFSFTLLGCILIQIATNLFNDAIDHQKGADTSERLGPRRATASGWLRPQTVMMGAFLTSMLAVVVSVPLVVERGWPIALIGVVSLLLAYGYTGGPWPLAYRGMGELFVIVFFGFVAVSGSWFVQSGEWGGAETLRLGLQCGLYSAALIAVNNLRDIEEDTRSGKRTLAVRFGVGFARFEILVYCLLPVLLWYLVPSAAGESQWVRLLPLPLGLIVSACVLRYSPGSVYNRILALTALQLLVFGIAATIGARMAAV